MTQMYKIRCTEKFVVFQLYAPARLSFILVTVPSVFFRRSFFIFFTSSVSQVSVIAMSPFCFLFLLCWVRLRKPIISSSTSTSRSLEPKWQLIK